MQAPLLLTHYKDQVVPHLTETHKFENVHEVPKITKVVLNSSVGSAADRNQALEEVTDAIVKITGQRPIQTISTKAISNFKLRENTAIGAKVTLRGARMYDFLLRFIKTAIPKIRDFRGVSPKSFDGNGNYTLGVSDQTIFPEIELDKVKNTVGFDVTIVTTATNDDHARELLRAMGMPFRDNKKKEDAQKKEEANTPE